ncbi:MAG: hypothetical protein E7381_04705 [Clostridiales bacterium]|nr:hypothetical protein [Clostridiales bacterium]
MKNSLSVWTLGAFTFTAVVGTLLHFLYQWTGFLALAPFCAVNESTWEHMKILFFPMLLFTLIQGKFFANTFPNYWSVKFVGTLIAVLLVPLLFYTYNGAFGKSPAWVNIAIFFLSAGIGYLVEFFLFKKEERKPASPVAPVLLFCLLTALFILWTFFPPLLPLFQDPVTGSYGLTV